MSWNVTGIGTKSALQKEVYRYFDSMIQSNPGTKEYVGAKAALVMLLESAPDEGLLQIQSWGSHVKTNSSHWPGSFDAKIELKLLAPTFKE